jgi:hypothetical protein
MKHRSLNGIKGVPDIIGLTRAGKFLGVEIKNKDTKDKLSAEQQSFFYNILEKNGLYFVVNSIEDFNASITQWL